MSKNDKTSKTARVMNLLSKKTDAAAPAHEPAPAAPVPTTEEHTSDLQSPM